MPEPQHATPLEQQWKNERDRAAAVMADDLPEHGTRIRIPQRLIEQLTPAEASALLEDLAAIRPLVPVIEPTGEPLDLSIGDTCPCCGEEWTGA